MRSVGRKMLFLSLIATFCSSAWAEAQPEIASATLANRQMFQCSLQVGSESYEGRRRLLIDIQNQQIILGQGESARDLQPIFVGQTLSETYFAPIEVMGTLYQDSLGKQKIKLGVYLIALNRGNQDEIAKRYHVISTINGRPDYYAHPLIETESDFSSEDEITLESEKRLGAHTQASYTHVKCKNVKLQNEI